jgi:hypothetical protein
MIYFTKDFVELSNHVFKAYNEYVTTRNRYVTQCEKHELLQFSNILINFSEHTMMIHATCFDFFHGHIMIEETFPAIQKVFEGQFLKHIKVNIS